MIFSSTSNYMLKYQKAKAKLVEYGIPQNEYPNFPLNSNELSYPIIYILSRYAESIIENNISDREEFFPHLVAAAQYFDAAVGAKDRTVYDLDFLMSGAAAYFLSDDFGSAKVLCSESLNRKDPELNAPQAIIVSLLGYLLLSRGFQIIDSSPFAKEVCYSLMHYYTTGEGAREIQRVLSAYRYEVYKCDIPLEIYYVDILCAIVNKALLKSSWNLLPMYSQLDQSLWANYLRSKNALRMLWPAQQLVGEMGILCGKSAVVQLPTGVGKTKSIELIIRSSFASERANTAIIVAPLRALCNEIANDMHSAFGNESLVNQFSDILEDDFSSDLFITSKSRILICTPEKLSYIIHHQADFIDIIQLFIFDESHMFDDPGRGAVYELLISEIRKHISINNQIVLLSAVLPNAEQIKDWLLGDDGVLASDPKIKATPKTVGFTSKAKEIHFYLDELTQEDFYMPNSIEVVELLRRPREKQRYFPELTDAKDIAIYYANKLCKNGAAAIFANQTRSVSKVIERIIELKERGYELVEIKAYSDSDELDRLAKLISVYYGDSNIYTVACRLGVLPHYSNLPNGLRLAIEHAFRLKKLCLVVCTTTLAQGVNIPIKYLFMTSFHVARSSMQIRSFQNLMGRTARSGMHTEGSVIVTDPRLFDNKHDKANGGYYKWRDCIKMFDSTAAEPCGSTILSLVRDVRIDYETKINGKKIAQYIIDHYEDPNCILQLINQIVSTIHEKYPKKSTDGFVDTMTAHKKTMEAIENDLCFAFSNARHIDNDMVATKICRNTLAYYMATDDEKALLESIFNAITIKIGKLSPSQIENYARTMVGIDLSTEIENWIHENQLTQQQYTNEQLMEMLVSFFTTTHSIKKGSMCFEGLVQMWIDGRSFSEMNERVSLPIIDIEDICNKTISYELSFFIGSIIDVVESNEGEASKTLHSLLLLQRRTKYGVRTETAVSICEKVFNDRFLANLLSEKIGNNAIATDRIVRIFKKNKGEILDILFDYPTYFSDRVKNMCGN